jgi:hypothetical protein
MNDFTLTDGERTHPLWLRLQAHLQDKLNTARIKNEDAALSEQETATLRGQIKCLRGLIALGTDRPIETE